MNKFSLAAIAATAISISAIANVPAGYYDSLNGKSGKELKSAVKALAEGHTVISYGEANPDNTFHPVYVASWTVFAESDIRTINDNLCWWDMYSSNNMRVADGHPGLNIEHSVPKSWWGDKAGNAVAYCDLHHLNPSDATANGQKDKLPLGVVDDPSAWTNGVSKVGAPKSGLGGGSSKVFEPHDLYKGDFARAYFYIFATYDDIPWRTDNGYGFMYDTDSDLLLKPWAYNMLLEWAAADPVSHKETDRNDVVAQYQGNRNPFIDCPELADYIWGSKQGQTFTYTGAYEPDDDPDYPGFDELPVIMYPGQWQQITSDADLLENVDYLLVAPKENRIMASTELFTSGKPKAMEVCFYSPLRDLVSHPEIITAIPEAAATVRLERAGATNWYVGVYDLEGEFKGYLSTTTKNNTILASNKNANGCETVITVSPEQTSIVFTLSDGNYTLQYNSSNPRISAYSSSQKGLALYAPLPEDEWYEDPEDDTPAGLCHPAVADDTVVAIFDLGGRRIGASGLEGLDKGIYIVVTASGTKKVRI